MRDLGLGHGDANTLVHVALQSDGQRAAEAQGLSLEDVVNEIYAGGKAPLRPIHDQLMAAINQFGSFEIVPKKGYVSLRRKKQFAMITPATKTRVEVGLNMKVKRDGTATGSACWGYVQLQSECDRSGAGG